MVTFDNNIGIGLENFLGKNSKYYEYLGDPKYLRFQKQKRFINIVLIIISRITEFILIMELF